MSLRFVGRQLLRTSPGSSPASVPSLSTSLWVHVSPGTDVTSPGGVVLLGDDSGRFAVTLSGLGDLGLSWKSSGGVSSFTRKLVVGGNHHVASTWRDGEQKYYLDGQLVLVDNRPGTMTIWDGDPPGAVRLGSDRDGVDVTLGEPTVWAGHVLSAEEVASLAARDARPREVAPESIAFRWSLAGPDGEAARIGDVGLVDASGDKHDLASIEGSAPTYRGSVLTAAPAAKVGSVEVAPSGTAVVVSMVDATGALSPIQALAPLGDVQVIALSGTPAGSTITLNFGGQATASIPFAAGPPATSAVFSCTLTPGTYDVQATWPGRPFGPTYTTQATYQIFDGQTLLGTVVCDQSNSPSGFTDPYPSNTSLYFSNRPNPWTPLGTYTISGTTLKVFLSAPAAPNLLLAGGTIRVQPHGSTDGSTVDYLGDSYYIAPGAPPNVGAVLYGTWTEHGASNSQTVAGEFFNTTPTGTTNTDALSASGIQSALLALPGVPAGSVAVSSLSDLEVKIAFGGALTNQAEPTIVGSDPALTVYHDGTNGSFVGGQNPSISINGGPPVPLKNPVWGATGGYQHYLVYPLFQSAPDHQFLPAGVGMFSMASADSRTCTQLYGQGYAGANAVGPWLDTQASGYADTMMYPFQGLPPGTYGVAATWPAASQNCPGAKFTVQDGSGNTLGTVTFDQTQAPADFSLSGFGWKTIGTFVVTGFVNSLTITLSYGTQSGGIVGDTILISRVSANTSVIIEPTDVVTFSAPGGFVVTSAGPAPSQTSVAVDNRSGGTLLPPFVSAPKTMKVGYDIEGDGNYALVPVYANLAHRNNWAQFGGGVTLNSDGYLTRYRSYIAQVGICNTLPDAQGNGRGLPNLDNGTYTLMWDGPTTTMLSLQSGSTTFSAIEDTSMASITGTTNNKRVYSLHDPYNYSPTLLAIANSGVQNPDQSWSFNFTNLRIYPPGVDPNNPPLFHPALIEKLKGCQCMRFLDPLGTNNSGVVEYSDLISPSTSLAYTGANRVVTATIVGVAPDHSTPRFFDGNRATMLVTTSAPHGFPDGAQIAINGAIGTVTLTNGNSTYVDSMTGNVAHVTSPTTFIYPIYIGDGTGPTLTSTLNPAGVTASVDFSGVYYSGWINLPDCITLCNQVGSDLWVNVPQLASDACVNAMATAIATCLNAGLKVHVEFSNECWNFGFSQWSLCMGMSQIMGGSDYSYFYVTQAVHVHNIFLSAFSAAGRATTDVRRVLGTQGDASNVTANIVARLKTLGATFDELANAPYYGNDNIRGPEASLEPIFDALTSGQLLDLMEMNVQFGGLDQVISTHIPVLQQAGFGSVDMVTYEGGIAGIIPNGSANSANASQRMHAAIRHPRMYGIQLAYNQVLQDAGCTLFNHFYLAGGIGDTGGLLQTWSLYEGIDEAPGTGNPMADAANIATPENIPAIKSERGGAMQYWQTLSGPQVPPRPTRTTRNGTLKAHGSPAT